MKKAKAVAGILLVFVLGAVAGTLGTHYIYSQRMEGIFRGEPKLSRDFIVRRLTRELDLDENQAAQLRTIVRETHGELREMRRTLRPQTEAILARSQERVRAILRPEQRLKYEKILEERKRRRSADDPVHEPPPAQR